MQGRIATIMAGEDIGASGTKVKNINIKEPISRISICWGFKVATVSVMTGRVLDCISRVELVDGADVKFSVTGPQLHALNCYNRKRMPFNQTSLVVGQWCYRTIELDFGRWLWDEQFRLDPSLYNNLQLRITWDEDAANGSVVENLMFIHAYVMDKVSTAGKGFIGAREIYSYDMAANGHEYIDIPVNYPLRSIMMQLESEDHHPAGLLSNIKASLDNDRKVLVNMTFGDFGAMNDSKYPRFHYHHTLDGAVTAKTIYCDLSQNLMINIQYDATDFVTAQSHFALPTLGGHKISLAASVDIKSVRAEIFGTHPDNCVMWLLGDEWSPGDALDVSGIENMQLDLTGSSDADSGDTGRIVVEQYFPK